MSCTKIEDMVGCTFAGVTGAKGDAEMVFIRDDGAVFTFLHHQDCCESVQIEDVAGDPESLVGVPITQAYGTSSSGTDPRPEWDESWTWTFYTFSTINGTVVVRWLGWSNGYYGEGVDLAFTEPPA